MSEDTADFTAKKQKKRIVGRPFQKGVSGNPKGRPKGSISLTSVIKRKLKEMSPDGKREAVEMLADNIIQDALDNNNKMRQLIWNYIDGLPKQNIKLGADENIESIKLEIYGVKNEGEQSFMGEQECKNKSSD